MAGAASVSVPGVEAGDWGWAFHWDPLPVLHTPSHLPGDPAAQVPWPLVLQEGLRGPVHVVALG